VAVKILQKDLMDNTEQERSKREIQIQRELNHPNIAKLYDVIETEDRINIVMEFSEGGELLTYITKQKQGKLNETEARRLFLQLLSAVQYCHSLNIIHRFSIQAYAFEHFILSRRLAAISPYPLQGHQT